MSNIQLLDLPVETKLEIIHALPAKDIARLSSVCRDFCSVVHNNIQHIATPIYSRELMRLEYFINHNITYKSCTSFLEAFSRWANHRGWMGDQISDENFQDDARSTDRFALHWYDLILRHQPPPSRSLLQIASTCFSIYCNLFLKPPTDSNQTNVSQLAQKMWSRRNRLSSVEEYEELFSKIMNGHGGGFIGPGRTSNVRLSEIVPTLLLTDLKIEVERSYITEQKPIARKEHFGMDQVIDILGVPPLPRNDVFAYAVRFEKSIEMIREATMGGKQLDSLRKAAIIADLYIY